MKLEPSLLINALLWHMPKPFKQIKLQESNLFCEIILKHYDKNKNSNTSLSVCMCVNGWMYAC